MDPSAQEKNRENLENFSARLNTVMSARRLRLQEVAHACKVSVSTVSGWKNAKWLPQGDALRLLATYLGVDPGWLSYGPSGDYSRKAQISSHSPIVAEPEAPSAYGSPVTRAKIEAYLATYLDRAEATPGGLGYAWGVCRNHLRGDDFDAMQ